MHEVQPPRSSLVGLPAEEIAELPALAGQPAFRGRQVAQWIYQKGARTFDEMTNLGQRLRRELSAVYSLDRLDVLATKHSADNFAQKFLFATADALHIEAVLIRVATRDTLCISTQAGCAFGCRFCATSAMGLLRNLTVSEIVSQVLTLRDALHRSAELGLFNVVFMGMGEPLANYAALVGAIRVLNDDFGLGIGRRRITVSTVGLVPRIRRLAREKVAVRLALSLNATRNDIRSALMPINQRYPIERLIPALSEYRERTGNRVTLEYVLIRGMNDSLDDARRLAQLACECGGKINLIRFNPHPLTSLEPSPPAQVEAFYRTLLPIAPAVTIRESRGEDIRAACGQLSTAYEAGAESGL